MSESNHTEATKSQTPAPKKAPEHPAVTTLGEALQKFQILGVVVAAIVGVFTVTKAVTDITSAAQKDVRDQIAANVSIYIAFADRAAELGLSDKPRAKQLLTNSLNSLLLQGRPEIKSSWMTWFVGGKIKGGIQQICLARRYAIDTHYSAADADMVPGFRLVLPGIRRRAAQGDEVAKAAAAFNDECVDQIDRLAQVQAAPADAPPPPDKPRDKTQARPPSEVRNSASVDQSGWDVDVFYCSKQGAEAQGAARAAADFLAAKADAGDRVGGESLGRIRLRALSNPDLARQYQADSDWVSADDTEKGFADGLIAALNRVTLAPKRTLAWKRNVSQSRWYVSIFYCA